MFDEEENAQIGRAKDFLSKRTTVLGVIIAIYRIVLMIVKDFDMTLLFGVFEIGGMSVLLSLVANVIVLVVIFLILWVAASVINRDLGELNGFYDRARCPSHINMDRWLDTSVKRNKEASRVRLATFAWMLFLLCGIDLVVAFVSAFWIGTAAYQQRTKSDFLPWV